jgi:PAS domain-containing protein
LISIAGDSLDFSKAYTTGIGDWDKITVTYAYGEFPENEEQQLQRILDDAFSKGFRYISDSDARAQGGAHAYAHLWDNGSDIVEELDNVLEVRKFAMDRFSLDNIKKDDAYTSLEDVFVPLYFYHRYQTEAVSKMIGGLDYAYAVKNLKQESYDYKQNIDETGYTFKMRDEKGESYDVNLTNSIPEDATSYVEGNEDDITTVESPFKNATKTNKQQISSDEMSALYDSLKKSTATKLAAERDKLGAIINSMGIGLMMIGNDGRISLLNNTAKSMLNDQTGELVGMGLFDILLPDLLENK